MTDQTRPLAATTPDAPDPQTPPVEPAETRSQTPPVEPAETQFRRAQPATSAHPPVEPVETPAQTPPRARRSYGLAWLVATGVLGLTLGGLGGALVHDAVVHSESGQGDVTQFQPPSMPGGGGPGGGSGDTSSDQWGAPQEQGDASGGMEGDATAS